MSICIITYLCCIHAWYMLSIIDIIKTVPIQSIQVIFMKSAVFTIHGKYFRIKNLPHSECNLSLPAFRRRLRTFFNLQSFGPKTPALKLFTLRKGYCISSSWGKNQLLELDLEVQTCTIEMILVSTVLIFQTYAPNYIPTLLHSPCGL